MLLVVLTILAMPALDFQISNTSPSSEFHNILDGMMHPNFNIEDLTSALFTTISFALQAVALSVLIGFIFAQLFHVKGVRQIMSALRAVHEIFWALMFIQIFGLSSLAGLLALTVPYSATFARVFAEIQQETPKKSFQRLKGGFLSKYSYSIFPVAFPRFASYSRYRLECAIRSSVVLGFIGLPTLGFHLDSYLKTGQYAEVAALIYILILLVLSMKLWTHRKILLPLILLSFIASPPESATWIQSESTQFSQFIADITPKPFKSGSHIDGDLLSEASTWFGDIFVTQALPGIGYTLLLGQLAFALSVLLALLWFPLISTHLVSARPLRQLGDLTLICLRCLPELLLTFIALILLGPSLIPGILALGIHNGAILAHLIGQHSNELKLRPDIHKTVGNNINAYFYEIMPGIFNQLMSFALYRGETILRETAVLGLIGIPTLGFYIDSAFETFRIDTALVLIIIAAALNILTEQIATLARAQIHKCNSTNFKCDQQPAPGI